jgi:hypothetical protein
VLYLQLIIFSVKGDVPVDNETLLVTDFVNLKIKPIQSFRGAHKDRVYVRVFIGVSARTYMRIYVLKKELQVPNLERLDLVGPGKGGRRRGRLHQRRAP